MKKNPTLQHPPTKKLLKNQKVCILVLKVYGIAYTKLTINEADKFVRVPISRKPQL